MESFLELCRNRRSYRKYTSQPVEREKLDYIVQCALMAPAGKRLNPWHFTVVTDESVIRQFAGCRTYGSGMFQTATAAIVVSLDTSVCDTWQADGAIAAAHILLAAADLGLGACWCQVYQREGAEELVKKALSEPGVKNRIGSDEQGLALEGKTILCIISLGYKDEERKPYDLSKLQYEKVDFKTPSNSHYKGESKDTFVKQY